MTQFRRWMAVWGLLTLAAGCASTGRMGDQEHPGSPSQSSADAKAAEPAYVGYTQGGANREREIERRAVEIASADTVQEFARTLASEPHVAGTERQAETRDYVLVQMTEWGLDTSVAEYEVYLPMPTESVLERVSPSPKTFALIEPAIIPDAATQHAIPFPPQHGYAAAGDVRGDLVYVNYGRDEDLDKLAELGVDVKGKIAIARYGHGYRGNKVRVVQERGALACLIYSDPADDGYFVGDVYPEGPMRPEHGIQRGSVKPGAPGDPTTPGQPSLPDAKRIDPADSDAILKIPSIPLSYANASELLKQLRGPEVPDGWQGALPFRYHVGAGPVEVHVKTANDGKYRKIWDTFGRIEGSEFPDEWIIVGGHRDAWCCGAADNVAGTSEVMEAARICGELARAGFRPRRTLIFATWDAEEWGIIGSAEWVEQNRSELTAKLVAYVNQDMNVTGPNFGAGGDPSLKALIRDVARVVPHPDEPDKSIYAVWSGDGAKEPGIGTPGGGSDHGPFFHHLGIPVSEHGFGGRTGIYHSRYDTSMWMEKFGDPGYRRHKANATMAAITLLRLANADVLPLDHEQYASDLLDSFEKLADDFKSLGEEKIYNAVHAAAVGFRDAGSKFRTGITSVGGVGVSSGMLGELNAILRSVLPALTRRAAGDGNGTEYYQNLVYGLAQGGGYRQEVLPGVRGAIAAKNTERLHSECAILEGQLKSATKRLEQATELLDAAQK